MIKIVKKRKQNLPLSRFADSALQQRYIKKNGTKDHTGGSAGEDFHAS